jgi:methyltransferase
MTWFFWVLFFAVIAQRMGELRLAARNGRRLRKWGAVEWGAGHYPFLVAIHVFFFISWWAEVVLVQPSTPPWWRVPLGVFLSAQGLRIWVLVTLGPYWNTRILVIPGMRPVRHGPYRWLRHPNYLAVILEMVSLPLIFGAWFTALVPTVLNLAFLLNVRIPVEKAALRQAAHSTMPSSTKSAK